MEPLLASARDAGPFLSLLVLIGIYWLDRRLRNVEATQNAASGQLSTFLLECKIHADARQPLPGRMENLF